MEEIRYDRLYRTPSSEAYLISQSEVPVGRVELHFTHTTVCGLLVLEKLFQPDEISELIERIDEDLVDTADVPREDFLLTVYEGKQLGMYSDPDWSEGGQEETSNELSET